MKSKSLLLHKLELQLMKIVWEKGRATAREVKDAIDEDRPLAESTIRTMLRSLETKGFLTHDVDEDNRHQPFVYRPVVQRDEVSRGMLSDLLDRLFDGSKELLLNYLFEDEDVSLEELQSLREKLAEKRGGMDDDGDSVGS
ncbi:BlaI/MecI/CopY family transcriptional regulator [Candidatus Poribacteria bacterium]